MLSLWGDLSSCRWWTSVHFKCIYSSPQVFKTFIDISNSTETFQAFLEKCKIRSDQSEKKKEREVSSAKYLTESWKSLRERIISVSLLFVFSKLSNTHPCWGPPSLVTHNLSNLCARLSLKALFMSRKINCKQKLFIMKKKSDVSKKNN